MLGGAGETKSSTGLDARGRRRRDIHTNHQAFTGTFE